MKIIYRYIFILLVMTSGCKIDKYLPAGEKLYRGAVVKVQRQKDVKTSERSLRKQLLVAARPRSNKFLFGRPYQVWWWYFVGEPKKPNGIRAGLRRLLGDPPILSSRINTKNIARNMNAYLENIGYFHSTVIGDTVNEKYYLKAVYTANIFPQHLIRNIKWINDSSALLKALDDKQKSILKKGRPFRVSDIDAERERLDLKVKSTGFYYFNPNYITADVDSTIGNYKVDLFFKVKPTTPDVARHAYRINKITIFSNYSLLLSPPDKGNTSSCNQNGWQLNDTVNKYKANLFKRIITYRAGDLYSSTDQNTTLNRLINLGVFKFVKNKFEATKDSVNAHKLNAFYYLTDAKSKSLQLALDGFSKENKYIGSELGLSWKNRNFAKGAAQISVKVYGALELSFNDTVNNNTNYRIGTEIALNLPKYLIPFVAIKERNFYPSRTQILLGYEYFIKPSFYTKNVIRLNYEFQWRESPNKQHILTPLFFTYINSPTVSDSFYHAALSKQNLLSNIYPQIILGSSYGYTYNTLNPSAKDQWFFYINIEAAGNIAGLIARANQANAKTIIGTPFAQYIKGDVDIRFTKKFNSEVQWASRFQIGLGLPYNNSAFLPLPKQYVIGGASSIRAYAVRSLGPGSYNPTLNDKSYFQTIGGDYKLLFNTELRITLKGRFSAAVFTDIGNIWTRDTILFGKAGQLKKDFLKELAIASGLGLRIDAGLVLLRLDIGIPLQKPYLPKGDRLVINKIALGDKQWRKENLNWNFAIGFPF